MPPAVEGVEQTHGAFLVIGGARLDYRTYYDLKQSAAYGIYRHSGDHADVWVGKQVGKHRQHNKTKRRKHVRKYCRGAVAYFVYQHCGRKVDAELDHKIYRYQKCDL